MGRIITIALVVGSILYAQPPQSRSFAGSSVSPRTPTPTEMAQRETDRLTRFFRLTTPQQSAVLGILTAAKAQLQPLTTQIKPLRATLAGAIKSNDQDLIRSTLHQLSNLQEQQQVIRANAAGKIYATVLTGVQQEQVGTGLGPLMREGPGRGGFRGPR